MLPSESGVTPSDPIGWWATMAGAVGLLMGGGFSALWKVRNDRKAGIEAHELSEDEQRNAHWESLLRSQIELVVDPLRKTIGDLNDEVEKLRGEVKSTTDLERATRSKYWRAVNHIRVTTAWIAQHMPPGTPAPPMLSADLAEDL